MRIVYLKIREQDSLKPNIGDTHKLFSMSLFIFKLGLFSEVKRCQQDILQKNLEFPQLSKMVGIIEVNNSQHEDISR